MVKGTLDVISIDGLDSLPSLFAARVQRSPEATAYRSYDLNQSRWENVSWQESAREVNAIRVALKKEGLLAGDRVAILLRNCPQWVFFEQAALALGLVVVPLYVNDRAENISFVLQDAGVKLLFVEDDSALEKLSAISAQLQGLVRVISLEACAPVSGFSRLQTLSDWQDFDEQPQETEALDIDALATLVYTSGTTGRPKGVMLSHRNILFNVAAALQVFPIYREDVMLSFLPLSHMFERTLGYYIPMMSGSQVSFARSVESLAEDLISQKPTILISVPRIYERVYNKIQAQVESKSGFAQGMFHSAVDIGWRRFNGDACGALRWPILKKLVADKIMAKLGGQLRLAICGGAPLSPEVAKLFIGLGLNLIQGYGLTEVSPIISGNPENDNDPASVGVVLPGVEVKIGDNDELLTRSPSVMLGYWNNDSATKAVIDPDGWFHSGDKATLKNKHISITGRIKEIIVLSNGEKVPPSDMEITICLDALIEQALVVGEGKPYLSLFAVVEKEKWMKAALEHGLEGDVEALLVDKKAHKWMLDRVAERLVGFPGYAKVRAITLFIQPWGIEDGCMTPTMKLRRDVIIDNNAQAIEKMYEGH
jgi:long-chain acyl-CoA synthetase